VTLMAASHRRSIEPELSRVNGPRTLNRGGVPNTLGFVATAPSVSALRRCVISARLPIGVLLYLVSVGFVGAGTVGLFFGSAFLLLAQPKGQIQTVSRTNDRDSAVDPSRSTEPFAGAENGAPPNGGTATLSSTASQSTIIASAQTAAPGEPTPSSRAASVPASRGGGSDHLRRLSRFPHSRSDTMPGEARAAAGHSRPAERNRKQDPEDYTAGLANQKEYDQLNATGPAVNLSSAALSP
jgi:hypothetical protein